jgi:hypothetical protein
MLQRTLNLFYREIPKIEASKNITRESKFIGKMRREYFNLNFVELGVFVDKKENKILQKSLYKGVEFCSKSDEQSFLKQRNIFYVGDVLIAFQYFFQRNKGHLNKYNFDGNLRLLRISTKFFLKKIFKAVTIALQKQNLSDSQKLCFRAAIQKFGYPIRIKKTTEPIDFYKNIYT